jgi:pimeloyl-ACP methyl ester carboxylesterase
MDDAKRIEVRANGIKFVAYEKGKGPLLLCLHGFPDHARSFRHQIASFADAGYRVVVPHMRGYAPTEPAPDGNYQTASLARDAAALIDALGADKAVLFGHDWGAMAAYGAALIAPERIEKLITAAVPYGIGFITAFLSNYWQLKRSWYIYFFQTPQAEPAVAAEDFAFVRNLWLDWSPGWKFPEAEMDSLRETFRKPGVLEAALGYYRSMLNPERQDPALAAEQGAQHLTPIGVPTLYLHGATDGCVGTEMTVGMDAMFPAGLRTVVVEGAGHFLHQEKPEVVNQAVLEFLGN